MKYELESAIDLIQRTINELDSIPEKEAIVDLISMCHQLDEYYKTYCDQIDADNDDPEGTSYKHGFNMEFYIEGDDWHIISLALRKLQANGTISQIS